MPFSNKFSFDELIFDKNGLIPAVAQDWLDGSILMLAWMNKESLKKTIETNQVHYWSRSRSELWKKGSTSGNIQLLKEMRFDCDNDSIILLIDQKGQGACHTGEKSCFFNKFKKNSSNLIQKDTTPPSNQCTKLFNTLSDRLISPKEGSYTNHLLSKGSNSILKKIGEETAEFIMACKDDEASSISSEAADIIYHLQVALLYKGVDWKDVLLVLAERAKGRD